MCECLTYEDGDRYQCEACATLDEEKERQLVALRASTADLAERLAAAERDIATFIESASDAHKRAEAAERERDEARRIAAEHRCVEINPTNCPTCSPLALAWDNPEDAVYDAAPTASRPMTRDEAEAVEEIESAMFTAPPADAACCNCNGNTGPAPVLSPEVREAAEHLATWAFDDHDTSDGKGGCCGGCVDCATQRLLNALAALDAAASPEPSTHALLKVEVKP